MTSTGIEPATGFHVPNRNLKDFTVLNVDLKGRKSLSARPALAANSVSRKYGKFKGRSVEINGLTDVDIFTEGIGNLLNISEVAVRWYVNCGFNPLNTKRSPLYLKPQSVPRCKHFSSRL